MENILSSLNDAQKEAVVHTEGYVRVIAGAGSGKTRALTYRYAYLVDELGISPSNILCLTFTNKAANEMKYRIKRMLGEGYDTSFVATLHGFCVRVLREDISKLFYPEAFVILDNTDQKKVLEEIYDELNIRMDTASFKFMTEQIKIYKNQLTYLDYITNPAYDFSNLVPQSKEQAIIFRYVEKQKKYFALDFYDLINFTIYLFDQYEEVLFKWQNRLHYVLVDEFQDITMKEFRLIKSLTDRHKNWFVVGDPDQNIYEWRGSRMEVLLDFDKKMTPCKTILLSQNYRSTKEILDASNTLISKNQNRIKKDLVTDRISHVLPEHFHGKNDKEEIKYIVSKIGEYKERGGKYSDIAILYRSNYVSRFIEQGLLEANIPYVVYGGIGFYERMEIKDVLAYMRMVSVGDDLSFKRVINVPRRKMGKLKMDFLQRHADIEGTSLYETLKNHIDDSVFKGSKAREFIASIESLRERRDELSVSELLQRILIETEYEMYIRESGDMERLDNIAELLQSIVVREREFGEHLSLSHFLQNISLVKDNDEVEQEGRIKIMTIHTAKGLEFSTVFVAGMSEQVFPSSRALEERKGDALEEERRLCFVAMTRAKEELYLTESEGVGLRGILKAPSRFLFDIEENFIKRIGNIPEEIMEEYRFQIREQREESITRYQLGAQVKHKAFGEGMIEEVDEKTKTYMIRFMQGIKPISFEYKGLSLVI